MIATAQPLDALDYAYRSTPPACWVDQVTHQGRPIRGLDDPALAACTWYVIRTAATREMAAALILERLRHAVIYP